MSFNNLMLTPEKQDSLGISRLYGINVSTNAEIFIKVCF